MIYIQTIIQQPQHQTKNHLNNGLDTFESFVVYVVDGSFGVVAVVFCV